MSAADKTRHLLPVAATAVPAKPHRGTELNIQSAIHVGGVGTVGGADAAQAPVVIMTRSVETVALNTSIETYLNPDVEGLLVREKFYFEQVLCGACERKTVFKVANWDRGIADNSSDEEFTKRAAQFQVREESECWNRYCFRQFRKLKLGVFPLGGTMHDIGETPGWIDDVDPILVMEKPCRCPIICGCCMFCAPQMDVFRPPTERLPEGERLGRAILDWKWFNCCWPGMWMNVEDDEGRVIYNQHRPMFCADGFSNCCAPSCCNKTHTTYIRQGPSPFGRVVGTLLNVWPGWNVRGVCMQNSGADNFMVKFPRGTDASEKALILNALFLTKFVFWDTRANQNNKSV